LWREAEARLPKRDIEAYTQGLMDLGSGLCAPRDPQCLLCPVNGDCVARIEGRTDDIPARRRRAPAPRRRVAMLVVISGREVLLEKRPPSGIWGGLWSLPEIDAQAKPAAALAREWGLRAAQVQPLPRFEHAFTHFTLDVLPWQMRVRRAAPFAAGKAGAWLALDDLGAAALPSPIRRLLASIDGESAGRRKPAQ
jgi:A/G-specific adenine glycosylase